MVIAAAAMRGATTGMWRAAADMRGAETRMRYSMTARDVSGAAKSAGGKAVCDGPTDMRRWAEMPSRAAKAGSCPIKMSSSRGRAEMSSGRSGGEMP